MEGDQTKPRDQLASSQRAILAILDAVNAHGDRAAIVAAHAALAKASAPNPVDERNDLRRQVVDLRDELAAMKAERDEKHDDAAEEATARTTAELCAEDAEAERDALKAAIEALAVRWENALAVDRPYARALRTALATPTPEETAVRRTEQDGGIPNDAITRDDWESACRRPHAGAGTRERITRRRAELEAEGRLCRCGNPDNCSCDQPPPTEETDRG